MACVRDNKRVDDDLKFEKSLRNRGAQGQTTETSTEPQTIGFGYSPKRFVVAATALGVIAAGATIIYSVS